MSKEMLKQADDWLKSMYDLLSLKTDNEDREYTQNKIDLFEWLIDQAERVQELERENKQIKEAYQDRCDDLDSLLEHFDTSWEEIIDE